MAKVLKIPKVDQTRFLVERRFPNHRILKAPPEYISSSGGNEKFNRDQREKLKHEIEEYESALRKLSSQEFLSVYEKEKAKHDLELIGKLEEEEKQRFYNLPYANADFVYWSKAAYWTIEECIALSFGKDPSAVNWDKMKEFDKIFPSKFVIDYRKTRELVKRANASNQLRDPSTPSDFIAWAKSFEIKFPLELKELVERTGLAITDWKAQYFQLKKENEQLEITYLELKQNYNQLFKESGQNEPTIKSDYFKTFHANVNRAINEYSDWEKKQYKVQKTGNLLNWLKRDLHLDTREAEITKKILSSIFKNLQ